MSNKYVAFITLCIAMFSCTKPEVLEVNQEEIQFDEHGGVVTVDVDSNIPWSASSSDTWCDVSKASAYQNAEILKINCSLNEELNDRTCIVTVSAGSLIKTIKVFQSEGKGTIVKKKNYSITSDAQEVIVVVEHNIPFSASVSYDDQSWISINSDTKSLQESKLVLQVKQNYNFQNRTGIVTIKAGNKEEEVYIEQEAGKENTNTANCYIVNKPGKYSLDAKYRGRTYIPVGTAKSAKVIWETCNGIDPVSSGCVISDCSYDESTGMIKYTIPNGAPDGNAIIAVLSGENGSGNILWSWHIWFVDQYDAEASAEKYPNGKVFMDRNLGALSAEQKNPLANGLLYQWGRKDPFAGKALVDGTVGIQTTSDLIYCAQFMPTDEYKTDVDFSIANPTTFIGNWNEIMDGDLWSDLLTIYNPCPKGWTIPKGQKSRQHGSSQDDGDWSLIKSSNFETISSKVGGTTYNDNSGKAISWYPASGRRLSENGNIEWFGNHSFFFWSQTINYAFSGIIVHSMGTSSYYYYDIKFGEYTQDDKGAKPAHGFSVRCVKE